MKHYAYHILRIGLAVTFIWIGVMIVSNPAAWTGYIQPWARSLLPGPIEQVMFVTGIFDVIVGLVLLAGFKTWIASFLAAGHIAVVMITSGINEVTVRDIGLFAAALALAIETCPDKWLRSLVKRA